MKNEQKPISTDEPTQVDETNLRIPRIVDSEVERLVHHPELMGHYRDDVDIAKKYAIAQAIIEHGGFPDPLFFLRYLTPPSNLLEADDSGKKDVFIHTVSEFGETLTNRLTQQLVDKGVIKPDTKKASRELDQLHQEMKRTNADDELLQLVVDTGWPIEVAGQLATVRRLSNLDEAGKLEEWRGWMTRSLYGMYLGNTLVHVQERDDISVFDIFDRLPELVFDDAYMVATNLIRNRIELDFMKHITDRGIDLGLGELEDFVQGIEDPTKRAFAEEVCNRLMEHSTKPNPKFEEKITLDNGEKKNFPSLEQMVFAYDFIHPPKDRRTGTRLVAAKTGLGKTGAAFYGMEEFRDLIREETTSERQTDASLVIVPAAAKKSWEVEGSKLFKDGSPVFVANSVEDFARATELINAPDSLVRYVVVSQQWLGTVEIADRGVILEEAIRMIQETGMDGAIIDEIDSLTDSNAVSVRSVMTLLNELRVNYDSNHPESALDAPVIGLTATPIRTGIEDLNVPMAMLYPEDYASSLGTVTDERKLFHDKSLNNPQAVYAKLIGEKRMFRWEQAGGVQEFRPEVVSILPTAFEEYLYQFVVDHALVTKLEKFNFLSDILRNPHLVRAEVISLAGENIPKFDDEEVMLQVRHAMMTWRELRGVETPQSEEDMLTESQLIRLGLGEAVLAAFFEKRFKGIDAFINNLIENPMDEADLYLSEFWQHDELSSKFKALKQHVIDSLRERVGEDGIVRRAKVSIVAEGKIQGITKEVKQKSRKDTGEIYSGEDLEELNTTLLLQQLRVWVAESGVLDPEKVLMIDGTVSLGAARDGVIDRWRTDADYALSLTGQDATEKSRDHTVIETIDSEGRLIDKLVQIYLGPPFYWAKIEQRAGRDLRQGQVLPVEHSIYTVKGLIDEGKLKNVEYTRLLTGMALSGIPLTEEEWAFFNEHLAAEKIPYRTKDSRYLGDVLGLIAGKGEEGFAEFGAKKVENESKNHFQKIAERFYDNGNDKFKASGHNALMIADLMSKTGSDRGRILSIGAGTLLLQRMLERGIDNLDMNHHMMEAAWDEAKQYGGQLLTGRASRLEDAIQGTYDAIDNAFTLHWSKLGNEETEASDSERVKILSGMNAALNTGGKLFLTLPESSLDEEMFGHFVQSLEEHFGFRVDHHNSGKSFGRNTKVARTRIGWCITAEKIGEATVEDLDLTMIMFRKDRKTKIDDGRKQKTNGTNGVMLPIDIVPIQVQFDQFEIDNPLKRRGELILPKTDSLSLPVIPADTHQVIRIPKLELDAHENTLSTTEEVEELSVVYSLENYIGPEREHFVHYRNSLVRSLRDRIGGSWEETEDACFDIMQRDEVQVELRRIITRQTARKRRELTFEEERAIVFRIIMNTAETDMKVGEEMYERN